MILSDRTIRERLDSKSIIIAPLDEDDIQPSSVDLHLAPEISVFQERPGEVIDVTADNSHLLTEHVIPRDEPFLLQPGDFALANTVESVVIPDDLKASLDGKSSLGRLGLLVHATAGYIDPGFRGTITLELSNDNKLPITLFRDMPIGQLSFVQLTTAAARPYGSPGLGSKYQNQTRPTPSRINEHFLSRKAKTAAERSVP